MRSYLNHGRIQFRFSIMLSLLTFIDAISGCGTSSRSDTYLQSVLMCHSFWNCILTSNTRDANTSKWFNQPWKEQNSWFRCSICGIGLVLTQATTSLVVEWRQQLQFLRRPLEDGFRRESGRPFVFVRTFFRIQTMMVIVEKSPTSILTSDPRPHRVFPRDVDQHKHVVPPLLHIVCLFCWICGQQTRQRKWIWNIQCFFWLR